MDIQSIVVHLSPIATAGDAPDVLVAVSYECAFYNICGPGSWTID